MTDSRGHGKQRTIINRSFLRFQCLAATPTLSHLSIYSGIPTFISRSTRLFVGGLQSLYRGYTATEGVDSSKNADHVKWTNSSARDVLSTVSEKKSIPAKKLVLEIFDALSTASKTYLPAKELVLVNVDALSTVSKKYSFAGLRVGAGTKKWSSSVSHGYTARPGKRARCWLPLRLHPSRLVGVMSLLS